MYDLETIDKDESMKKMIVSRGDSLNLKLWNNCFFLRLITVEQLKYHYLLIEIINMGIKIYNKNILIGLGFQRRLNCSPFYR